MARSGSLALAVVLALAGLAGLGGNPAAAEEARANSSPSKANKEADELNARNPRVFHAGPGKPLSGAVWSAPSSAVKKPAADAKH
jgi:hypothetical protein